MEININGNIENLTLASNIATQKYIQKNNNAQTFKTKTLLLDIIDKAIRMAERKFSKKIEDIHNDDFTDWLRDKGYIITDQTRSGRSIKGSGELDIMVRKENGTPVSIIEALKLKSCGLDNKVIVNHLNKLLNDYDTIGNLENFIIIYSEAKDFSNLWSNYFYYINNINSNVIFKKDYKLINFSDITMAYTDKADIRIGAATHLRNTMNINLYHVFINMFCE